MKKLLIWNTKNNQFEAINKNQTIISFNNKQISPRITEKQSLGLIDLSEDFNNNNYSLSNIENDTKRRKYFPNNNFDSEKSGIVDLTSEYYDNTPNIFELITFQETENILFLVAINKSSNTIKIEIEIETCNYNMTCPFATKKMDFFSQQNFPTVLPPERNSREKFKCSPNRENRSGKENSHRRC